MPLKCAWLWHIRFSRRYCSFPIRRKCNLIIGEAELVAAFLAFAHLLGEFDQFRDELTGFDGAFQVAADTAFALRKGCSSIVDERGIDAAMFPAHTRHNHASRFAKPAEVIFACCMATESSDRMCCGATKTR
jgi:hypothetical protein